MYAPATIPLTGILAGTGITTAVFIADTNNDTIRLAATPVAPLIAQQPQSQTVAAGKALVTFTVVATGNPAPTYQWYFAPQGTSVMTPISGATGPALGLVDVQAADAGGYSVTLTNYAGSTNSDPAVLTVNSGGGGGGSSGGGGGAPSVWFCCALSLLALARRALRRK